MLDPREGAVRVDVGHVVGVLVPDGPSPHPAVGRTTQDEQSGLRCVRPGRVRGDDDLGMSIGIDIGYDGELRSDEHTSELQSLMRISYAVFCLKKKTHEINNQQHST